MSVIQATQFDGNNNIRKGWQGPSSFWHGGVLFRFRGLLCRIRSTLHAQIDTVLGTREHLTLAAIMRSAMN